MFPEPSFRCFAFGTRVGRCGARADPDAARPLGGSEGDRSMLPARKMTGFTGRKFDPSLELPQQPDGQGDLNKVLSFNLTPLLFWPIGTLSLWGNPSQLQTSMLSFPRC